MTHKIFYVVRSTPTPQDHAKRMKILVNPQTESNTSTIDLNNKRLHLLIVATSLYLDYQYSSVRSPRLLLISNSWTFSKASDRSSSQRIRAVVLPKNSHTFIQELRELILVFKSQMILSVIKSLLYLVSKYKQIKLPI